MPETVLTNARVVLHDEVVLGTVCMNEGVIADVAQGFEHFLVVGDAFPAVLGRPCAVQNGLHALDVVRAPVVLDRGELCFRISIDGDNAHAGIPEIESLRGCPIMGVVARTALPPSQ